MQQRRIVKCRACGARFIFRAPQKPGVYKVVCPRCQEQIYFKIP